MKKLFVTIVLLATMVSASFGQGEKEYARTLKKMFEVSGTEESYKTVIKQMVSILQEQYSEIDRTIWDDLEKEFLKTSLDELVVMLVPVYEKYLTKEDLEGIISFYESPVGQKYAGNVPLIMQESMQVGQEWGRKIGEDFVKKLEEQYK